VLQLAALALARQVLQAAAAALASLLQPLLQVLLLHVKVVRPAGACGSSGRWVGRGLGWLPQAAAAAGGRVSRMQAGRQGGKGEPAGCPP
jgi:hypothetical protein